MSKSRGLQEILDQAKQKEKTYDWATAAELYEQALGAVGKGDFSRRGEIQEQLSHCFHRTAFQAESNEEFRDGIQRAIVAYEKTRELYENGKDARRFRCDAVTKYLGYWLTSDPSEKRALLDQCLELESKTLVGFLESGNTLEYVRTYNKLPLVFWFRVLLEWDRQALESVLKDGLEWGEKAVGMLRESDDPCERARAHLSLTFCLSFLRICFLEAPEEQEETRLKTIRYLSEAVDILEKAGDAFLLGLSHFRLGANIEGSEAERHFEGALECGKQARDNFLIAVSQDFLAYSTYWRAIATENPDKKRRVANKAMELYDEAQHRYSIMSFAGFRPGLIATPAGYAEHYLELAKLETDLKNRREFLEKAENEGIEALKSANSSAIPTIVASVLHVVSKVLEARARIESDLSEKSSLLERALKHRERGIEIQEQLAPFYYWNMGVFQNYLASIKAELADLKPDLDSRTRLIEAAISNAKKCIELCTRDIQYFERMGQIQFFAALQGYQDSYAALLNRSYQLTNNREHLEKAIEILNKAIESASKLDLVSLIAESYWKIAKAQDLLGEHVEAAKNYERASESYEKATEKIPQLKEFYKDHALYMQAWSEIQKARQYHGRQEYGKAKEHYSNAADLHKSTERWKYLSQNYSAWARLEAAEDLSRREQTEEARELFRHAAELFAEAKKAIQAKSEEVEGKDETEMLVQLAKASDVRREYCLGRIALEEARILDRKGDHAASSRRYGSAAERFQKITEAMEDESDRQELKPIAYLCEAWKAMTRAEAEASPDMYEEASRLFEEAKEHSLDEKAKMLSLGHSRFCRALEAGTRFEDTRDLSLYSAAKRHLEAAANYYLKAGFKSASEYARATQRLFDAYMYTHKADTETDLKKKAELYRIAGKFLQASAGSYMKAKHPEKSEEVQRLLESVKEEQQLVTSLTGVLHAPTATSTTTSFSTPTPTREQAVGLERFEHADIQANLILRIKEVIVGEDVAFRMELVNAGKAPALLIKVDEIIPKGFEMTKAPEICAVEDNYLNMKGRQLNPLKTADIEIVVKPRSKGTFSIKPRVLYIDETGKYKSHEPEPVTITVKELGIKGWIKGEK